MSDPTADLIADFLAGETYAVVGASRRRAKYGNKVLRAYLQAGRTAFPVNRVGGEVEGLAANVSLADLPAPVHGVSIIVPPDETLVVARQIIELGLPRVWMQPGAEHETAVRELAEAGVPCIHGGPCVLVALRYREG